jgi:hypothetical protein
MEKKTRATRTAERKVWFMNKQGKQQGAPEARVELIDNWHKKWPATLALIKKLGAHACLMIDEDGWLSARQNLLVAFEAGQPLAFLCFSVQPMLRDGAIVVDAGHVAVEASVDGSGFDADADRKKLARQLLEAAMNRALELGCKKFHGKSRVDV